jgi:hypothetical protein
MSEAKTKSTRAAKKPAETAAATPAPATPVPAAAPKAAAAAPAPQAKPAPKEPATTIVLSVDDAPAAKPAAKPRKQAEPKTKAAATQSNMPDQAVIDKMVAEAAYYLAEKRNFAVGFEEEDWLKAREQIMTQLLAAEKPGKG